MLLTAKSPYNRKHRLTAVKRNQEHYHEVFRRAWQERRGAGSQQHQRKTNTEESGVNEKVFRDHLSFFSQVPRRDVEFRNHFKIDDDPQHQKDKEPCKAISFVNISHHTTERGTVANSGQTLFLSFLRQHRQTGDLPSKGKYCNGHSRTK